MAAAVLLVYRKTPPGIRMMSSEYRRLGHVTNCDGVACQILFAMHPSPQCGSAEVGTCNREDHHLEVTCNNLILWCGEATQENISLCILHHHWPCEVHRNAPEICTTRRNDLHRGDLHPFSLRSSPAALSSVHTSAWSSRS